MASLLLGLTFLLQAAPAAQAATPGEVPVGGTLREARMKGLNGADRALSELRGQPLIINVWASWCGPCRAEMASLERLAWLEAKPPYPTRFRIIGISTDDDRQAALGFLKQINASISHYIDRQLELEHMLGASHLPLTLLIDAQGKVLMKVVGSREWDAPAQRAMIEQAFATAAGGARKNKAAANKP
jgi:thiol-disulfide isomerase/thioredoxin